MTTRKGQTQAVHAVLMITFAAGCSAGAPVTAKLSECGLLSDGDVGTRVTGRFYQPTDCYRQCLDGASCAELQGALCGTSIDLLRRCDERCAHHCDDGTLIAVEDVCDGAMQCAGGEDERGCPTLACMDGSTTTGAACDGRWDCPDGSDEQGCPSCESRWGGTMPIDSSIRCDGYMACADGSDEQDCPEYRCDDGTTFTYPEGSSRRCDGWTLCPDGSDEAGCAELTLTCGA